MTGKLKTLWSERSSSGELYVYLPEHRGANKQGYVPEHRLVMEAYVGRALTGGEVVHHVDCDKKNNRLDNLELMSFGEHSSLHIKRLPRNANGSLAKLSQT